MQAPSLAVPTQPRWQETIERIMQWVAISMPLALAVGNALSDPLMSTIGVVFLLRSAYRRDWDWLRHRWVQAALAFWLYMIVRALFTEHIWEALERSIIWGRFPLTAAGLAFWLLRDAQTRQRVLWVLTVVILGLLADTFLQYVRGVDILGIPLVDSPISGIRLTGPFTNPKIGIVLTWICFPALLAALMTEDGKPQPPLRLVLGGLFVVAVAAIVLLTGERMAVLLMLFGLGLAFLMLPMPRHILALVILFVVISMAGILYARPHLMERQWDSTRDVIQHFPDTIYGKIWESGWNVSKGNFLVGVGPKHFRYTCPQAEYGDPSPESVIVRCNLHPHNYYFEIFAETGVIGFSLFIAMIGFLLRDAIRGWRCCRLDPIYLALLITLIVRFWPVATTTSFFSNWAVVPFWFYVGWLLALIAVREKQSSTQS